MTATVAVLTGGAAGIGAELALLLAARGFDLGLVVRHAGKAEAVRARLNLQNGQRSVRLFEADLADQDQIEAAASQLNEAYPRIDVLVNNAGILLRDRQLSRHGNELQFQVNVLAPYLLTQRLQHHLAGGGRVLNVSSGAIFFAGRLNIDGLRNPPPNPRPFGVYGQSKLALTTLTNALAAEYQCAGIVLRSADPGGTRTGMTAGDGMPWLLRWVTPFFKPPEQAAREMMDAIFSPAFGDRAGLFIAKSKEKEPPADAGDPVLQKRLVELCRDLCGA